ncbi:MAG: transcriptional regulator, TetR family [Devosia sp.]|nr:transcriptional regulator, TetR family [Devosia sp.]
MSTPLDRRSRKRLAMRQNISDVASRLFVERGFDQVTVDDIAVAADVSRMTVFNHFPRKEDMFFDLDELGREDLHQAFEQFDKDGDLQAVEALRLFVHQAVAERRPYTRFMPGSEKFVATVMASEALKARARAIRDELTATIAVALSSGTDSRVPDTSTNLAAALITATLTTAFLEGHRVFRLSHDGESATATFLAVIDQGWRSVAVAQNL